MTDFNFYIKNLAFFKVHPLGFFYFENKIDERRKARLHVWDSVMKWSDDNEYHTHSFDIHSKVLLGTLNSKLFNFKCCINGDVKEYKVSYENNTSKLFETGRKGFLEKFVEFETNISNSYNLSAGIIHVVNVIHRPCVTHLETVEQSKDIFVYGNTNADSEFQRRYINDDEKGRLKEVIGNL
jgi:hypothetical protein